MVANVDVNYQKHPRRWPEQGKHIEVAKRWFGQFSHLGQPTWRSLVRVFSIAKSLCNQHRQIGLNKVDQRPKDGDSADEIDE